MRDVGDVDPELPLRCAVPFQANGVVEIFRVVGIDRNDLLAAAIDASVSLGGFDFGADGLRFGQHALGKMQRQPVLADDREHIDPLGVGWPQDFDDFTLGVCVARFPLEQIDDDLVADVRGPARVARRRDVNVVRNARIIRDDVKKLLAALQSADELGAGPFEDAHDAASGLSGLGPARHARRDVAAH